MVAFGSRVDEIVQKGPTETWFLIFNCRPSWRGHSGCSCNYLPFSRVLRWSLWRRRHRGWQCRCGNAALRCVRRKWRVYRLAFPFFIFINCYVFIRCVQECDVGFVLCLSNNCFSVIRCAHSLRVVITLIRTINLNWWNWCILQNKVI